MKPRIIALTGPKGVGKSTVAAKLVRSPFVGTACIMSFAGPLKEMARILLRPEAFLPENKENPLYGLCGRSPRHVMQTLGTDWGRVCIHEDIWTEAMRLRIKQTTYNTVIIDDVRFTNEAEMLLDLGAKVFLVEREGVSYTCEHASERPVDPTILDGTIVNRSIEDLESMVRIWNPFA